MTIRPAAEGDINSMALLAAQKRRQYEKYQPMFHKESPSALGLHSTFLKDSLSKENTIILVSESDGRIDGFIIGAIVNAPPVYAPGGKICFVDDFMVEKPDLWTTVGQALLEQVTALAKEKGAVLTNVVCGPLDLAKKDFLTAGGFSIASEWHVKPID